MILSFDPSITGKRECAVRMANATIDSTGEPLFVGTFYHHLTLDAGRLRMKLKRVNLLNSDWGIVREHSFPALANLYTVSGLDSQGRYIISGAQTNPDADTINVDASLWQVRLGARYDF